MFKAFCVVLVFSCIGFYLHCEASEDERDLIVITVASNRTDGLHRFLRSAKVYGLNVTILGLGEKWRGGNIVLYPGGGYKINLLRTELEKHKSNNNLVIVFTDSYDVIFTEGKKRLLDSFDALGARVVFGAEDFCWPKKSLAEKYPEVLQGYKYLNSGGFMGYAPEMYAVVSKQIDDTDDDQLYYTEIFLDATLRELYQMTLDSRATIFQNLHGNSGDVSLNFLNDDTEVINRAFQTTPVVIHGNGFSKNLLNSLGNYLAKSWNYEDGCIACDEDTIPVEAIKESPPHIVMALFVEKPLPFLEEMLEKVANLTYPKNKIDLFVHCLVPFHSELVSEWLKRETGYHSVKYISPDEKVKEWHARNLAVKHCQEKSCDALLVVDGDVHLDNPDTLLLLLSYNRTVLGAIVVKAGQAWASFWGAITDDGYYARSTDYMHIIQNERRGIWNVPYITGVYLIRKEIIRSPENWPNYIHHLLDADMAMAANFRDKGVFMYATNLDTYGHLIDPDYFTTKYLHNDMWQMVANRRDWERRYIHPQYWQTLNPNTKVLMPCPDVYWYPLFTERFCRELIEMMEHFGKWSSGSNVDERLAGGYENVPTVDIHMNQVEYEQEWLWILKTYVKPVAEKIFVGYTSDARAIMNFVVRYKPSEQAFLKPHHDSSTYTLNVCLNRPGVDYQGGGARFVRYNCSVPNTQVGWALTHPGRLTHYHEGLPTTSGTRYIMVSFIDP